MDQHHDTARLSPAAPAVGGNRIPIRVIGTYPLVMLFLVSAMYISYAIFAVVSWRHLYGDASWYLLKLLSENHVAYWHTDFSRDFFVGRIGTFVYTQYPTLLLSRLGVKDLAVLSVAYGLTLFFWKIAGLGVCAVAAKDKRLILFPLLCLFSGAMNAEGYLISEGHLLVALFWPVLFLLLFTDTLLGWAGAVLLVFSAPLILCYEPMAILGVFLCAACGYRLLAVKNRLDRILCGLCALWYLLGITFAWLSIILPRDPIQRSAFSRGLLFVLRSDHIGVRISGIVLAFVVAVILIPASWNRLRRWMVTLSCLISTVPVFYIFAYPERTSFNVHIPARTLNLVVPVVVAMIFVGVCSARIRINRTVYAQLFLMTCFLGLGQLFWHVEATMQWSNMLRVLRSELHNSVGPIPFDSSIMSQAVVAGAPIRNLHADWPLLPLSILCADAGNVKSVIVPGPAMFRPFDPLSPDDFPKLARYGVRYDTYRQALAETMAFGLGDTISFTSKGNATRYEAVGWSHPEEWGTWTDGSAAELRLYVKEIADGDVLLGAVVGAFVNEAQPTVTAQVYVNGSAITDWNFDYTPTAVGIVDREALIPDAVFNRRRPVAVAFKFSQTRSPAELGMGGDPRHLGLGFVRLTLRPSDHQAREHPSSQVSQ